MATRIRGWAEDTETDATGFRRDATGVEWQGTAGDAFLDRIMEKAREVDHVATSMREAATALDDLAGTLESRQAILHDLMQKAGATIEEVRALVADGVTDILGSMEDLADQAMDELDDLKDGAVDRGKDLIQGGKDLLGL